MDEIETGAEEAPERWAERPFLLAGLGLATGIAVHLLLGNMPSYRMEWTALQLALLMGVTLFAAVIGFTIERRLWWASILFAAVVGVVAGLVTWWNGGPTDWSSSGIWRTLSLLLAVAIAAPLFQAARDEGAPRTPYASVHDYAWTNVVLWCACWLFVLISFLMLWLLASLFQLIKIGLLHDLLMENWFWRALIGLAFGGALGLLREHDAVVRLLQRVVATVLAVLAPVLAVGLALFLVALPFTGLQALWDATSQTTPLLLSCAMGALILTNAVIGNRSEEERRSPPLRFGAVTLALVLLPLAILAAVATGLRVGQYGYTPDRLWAIVFVGIAILYGAAYLGSLILGRLEWTAKVRPANLMLAFAICGLGLVLATPLISFNHISTEDQLARLKDGRTKLDRFDWKALAFDFGQPGKNALARLSQSPDPKVKVPAQQAMAAKNRWDFPEKRPVRADRKQEVLANARILPAGASLPPGLAEEMNEYTCTRGRPCTLFVAAPGEVFQLADDCFKDGNRQRADSTGVTGSYCAGGIRYTLVNGKWQTVNGAGLLSTAQWAQVAAGYPTGKAEVRKVERRQLFIGGVPVGDVFE